MRFDDRVTGRLAAFAPHAKVIHVDIDPAEIGKNRAADLPIVGDLKRVLPKLNRILKELQPQAAEQNEAARRSGGRGCTAGRRNIRWSRYSEPTRSNRSN